MNHQLQTLKFVIAAVVALGLAWITSIATQPSPVEGFGLVGEVFFDDIDSGSVTGLRVITTSEDTASSRVFKVALKDGAFRIESRNNYPADGEEQLAKTANALLGVKREALVSRVPADHEKYGVVDPLDEDADSTEGRGHRVTLYKDDDVTIADLVIGKQVEGQTDQYYVRKIGEDNTFIAQLDFEVSTKFGDWVEDDMLKMDRDDLIGLESTISTPNMQTQSVTTEVLAKLDRKTFSDPWVLEGLNEDSEELNEDRIRDTVNTLDNLKLIGVRARPELQGKKLLNSDLTIPGEFRNQIGLIQNIVQSDLVRRGFQIFPTQTDLVFLAKAGEIVAKTKKGVEYHLSFGNEFSGTEEEMELGGSEKADDQDDSKQEKKDEKAEEKNNAEATEDGDDKGPGTKTTELRGRYVFARAVFNQDLLGDAPTEPIKPTPPTGVRVDKDGNVLDDKADNDKADNDKADDNKNSCDEPAPQENTDEKKPADPDGKSDGDAAKAAADKKSPKQPAPKDGTAKSNDQKQLTEDQLPKADPKPDPVTVYKADLAAYRQALQTYKSDVAAHEKKIEEGKEEVEKLNKRFADWYYVISADDYAKLKLSREEVVKPKEKPAADKKDDTKAPLLPEITPGEKKDDNKNGDKKPAAADEKSGDDAKADSKQADETAKSKNSAKPADGKSADDKKAANNKAKDSTDNKQDTASDKEQNTESPNDK